MSDKINDGGPAFPESYTGEDRPHDGIGGGMSLRDYFAAALAAGMCAARDLDEWDALAAKAYGGADAMLAERERKMA